MNLSTNSQCLTANREFLLFPKPNNDYIGGYYVPTTRELPDTATCRLHWMKRQEQVISNFPNDILSRNSIFQNCKTTFYSLSYFKSEVTKNAYRSVGLVVGVTSGGSACPAKIYIRFSPVCDLVYGECGGLCLSQYPGSPAENAGETGIRTFAKLQKSDYYGCWFATDMGLL